MLDANRAKRLWQTHASFIVLALLGSACRTMTPAEVRALGQQGDLPAILSAYHEAETDAVKIAAVDALALHPEDADGRRVVLDEARAGADAVRVAAIRALQAYAGGDVIQVLIDTLGVSTAALRELAEAILIARKDVARPVLLSSLVEHPNHLVRGSSARILARISQGDLQSRTETVEALIAAARRDDAPRARESAVAALGSLGAHEARILLEELRKTDADPSVRMRAEESLGKIGDGGKPNVVVMVLPLRNATGENDPAIALFGQQVAEYVAARLSAANVCEVVDPGRTRDALSELAKVGVELYDGASPNAPAIGYFKIANQLVYGVIQKQGLAYTIVLQRLDIATLTLVPGASATVTGYRADLEQLKAEVTDRFVEKLR